MRVVKIYFSPTGNTKKIVDAVALGMEGGDVNSVGIGDVKGREGKEDREGREVSIDYDLTLPQKREEFKYSAQAVDIVIVGMPVYAGRIPNLLLPFVKSICAGANLHNKMVKAIPIVTYGGRNYDDALIELADILDGNGFDIVAAGAFIAEHSFSSKICNSLPDNDSLSFAAKLGKIAIGKGGECFGIGIGIGDVKGVGISVGVGDVKGVGIGVSNVKGMGDREGKVNGGFEEFRRNEIFVGKQNIKGRKEEERVYYKPRFADGSPINMLKVKPKTKENCLKCGLCAKRCPMGSISVTDPTVITGPCIKCNRCVRECKVRAKYFDDAGYLFHVGDLEMRVGNGYDPVK